MNLADFSSNRLTRAAASILFLCCLAASTIPAQTPQTAASNSPAASTSDEKAEQILKRVVETMGGNAYMSVRSVTGRGKFTQFKDGVSGLPVSFLDYIVYPDKERTEFKGGGTRIIQANTGDKGWVFDGAAKTLKDMKPDQVADFQLSLKTSVDHLLRGAWRKEGAKLSYAGRREADVGRRNEAVRLVYPDGFAVEFEFGARDNLPAKVLYKKKNAEGEEVSEEDRMAQFVTIEGIVSPFIIDHYSAGVQTSRVNYESVEYNRPLPDSLFERPANIKAIK